MKRNILILVMLSLVFSTNGQTTQNPGFGSDMNTGEICTQLAFTSDAEVNGLVDKILNHAGISSRNYSVKGCDNVYGCFATVKNNQQYIVYNPTYLSGTKLAFSNTTLPKSATDWQTLTILAHEVGHLVNGHFFNCPPEVTPREKELQADKFAGRIIHLMGGSLADAQRVYYSSLVPENGDMEHPPRGQRLEAVEKGYNETLVPNIINIDDFFGNGYNSCQFGTGIGHVFGNLNWNNLLLAGEYKNDDVRYFCNRSVTEMAKDNVLVQSQLFSDISTCVFNFVLLYDKNGLFRISIRLIDGPEPVRRKIITDFANIYGGRMYNSNTDTRFTVMGSKVKVVGLHNTGQSSIEIATIDGPRYEGQDW